MAFPKRFFAHQIYPISPQNHTSPHHLSLHHQAPHTFKPLYSFPILHHKTNYHHTTIHKDYQDDYFPTKFTQQPNFHPPFPPWSFLLPTVLPLHFIPILHQKLIFSLTPVNNGETTVLFRPEWPLFTSKPHFPPLLSPRPFLPPPMIPLHSTLVIHQMLISSLSPSNNGGTPLLFWPNGHF